MRLGIFGGTFDPVHYGHLLLAECCREQCRLDRIWFVPAAAPPNKQEADLTPANDRVEMLRLAVAGHEAFDVSTVEVERGGVSYTAETLEAIHDQHPQAKLFFLMGADSLRDLPSWRNPDRICQLAMPVVVHRPEAPAPDYGVLTDWLAPDRVDQSLRHQVEIPLVDFSSTRIRDYVSTGKSIRYQTPRAVEKYLQTHGLYRP